MRRSLLVGAAVLSSVVLPPRLAARQRTPAADVAGGYDAVRYNGRALPAQDRFPGKAGFQHVARLDQMYVILKPNGTFVAGGRYVLDYRSATDRHPLPRPADETTRGRWTRRGSAVTFRPEPPKGRRPIRPIGGVVTAGGLTVTYQVETRTGPRTLRLELVRNPNLLY